jgi:hypothetical protein
MSVRLSIFCCGWTWKESEEGGKNDEQKEKDEGECTDRGSGFRHGSRSFFFLLGLMCVRIQGLSPLYSYSETAGSFINYLLPHRPYIPSLLQLPFPLPISHKTRKQPLCPFRLALLQQFTPSLVFRWIGCIISILCA